MTNTKESPAYFELNYQDDTIAFRIIDGVLMVNTNEMAKNKPCRLSFNEFAKTPECKKYIGAIRAYLKTDVFKMVVRGGAFDGVWVHELLAIKYAQAIDFPFGVWFEIKAREISAYMRKSNEKQFATVGFPLQIGTQYQQSTMLLDT